VGVEAPGETSFSCDPSQPDAAIAAARAHVESVDRAIEAESGLGSALVPYLIVASLALGVLVVLIALGFGALKGMLAAITIGAVGVGLTWGVERLPGTTPMTARLVLFVLGNVPALLLLVAPAKMGLLAQRARFVAPAIVPGFLIATYTTSAQPESWVAIIVCGLLLVLLGGLAPERPTLLHATRMLHPVHGALFAVGLAALFFAGTRTTDIYPAWLRSNEPLMMAFAITLLALTSVSLFARANPPRWLMWAVVTATGLGAALVLRRHVPPLPGRALVIVSVVVGAYLAVKDRRLHALIAGLFTYCWISRDQELLTLAPTLLVADAAGAAFARHRIARGTQGSPLRLPDLLLCTAFLFGLVFVQRIGIQGAIDFGAMDWGAASFGDVHVSPWTVGAGIATKYALALVLALGAFASELGPKVAEQVLCAAFVAFVARSVLLVVMFLVAGGSFWTGLRLLGDMPMALTWAVATGLAWIASRYVSLVSSSS